MMEGKRSERKASSDEAWLFRLDLILLKQRQPGERRSADAIGAFT